MKAVHEIKSNVTFGWIKNLIRGASFVGSTVELKVKNHHRTKRKRKRKKKTGEILNSKRNLN